MSIVGIRQNYSQNIRETNNFSLSGTGNTGKTRPYNGGAVTVNRAQNLTQEQVLLEAFRKFAAQAGITDPAAQNKFAQKWLNEFKSGGGANLLYGGKADSAKFEADRKDGKISLSLAPGSHDAIIRDLRNLQVQQGLITFSEANFTPIAKNAVTGESLTDSLLNSGYDEFQIFDPAQAKRIGVEQKYRDNQYQTIAQDATMGELALDLTQMGLDIVGIFEPTPFADGANTIISAVRGDWGNAALSVIGIVPYVGDLAKFGKIPKWIASIEKISIVVDKLSDVAKLGGKAADAAKGFVREVERLLNKIPIEKLPDTLRDAFKSLKGKVDDFFAKMKKVDNPIDDIKKSEKITDTSKTVDNVKPKTTDGTTTTKQPEIEPPKKPKKPIQKGKLDIEAGRTLSASEQKFADKMIDEGRNVKARKEVNQQGVKNPDFEIDGEIVEFKHISDLKGTNADKLSGGLSRRILDGKSQASKVSLDVTDQAGMTKEIAERAVDRAYGALKTQKNVTFKEVRIYGKDFDFTIPFKK